MNKSGLTIRRKERVIEIEGFNYYFSSDKYSYRVFCLNFGIYSFFNIMKDKLLDRLIGKNISFRDDTELVPCS